MLGWEHYGLTDMPFLGIPAIKINSKNIRANGQIYYSKFAEKEISEMLTMIRSNQYPWVFLESGGPTLGNGKSAFMAHVYWILKNEGRNVLWATARYEPRIRNLLAEIVESFVSAGKIRHIKENLEVITSTEIGKALSKSDVEYGYNTIRSLEKLLQEDEYDLIYTFSSIKRRVPTQEYAELFGALINLSYVLDESRYTIFIDQFEEYVRSHEHSASMSRLMGHQINDLQRDLGEYVTFVVSTHPQVTNILTESVTEGETFTRVNESSIDLPVMLFSDLVNMIELYLRKFRIKDYDKSRYHPFTKSIITYSAHMTDLIPRNLIIAMRQALIHCAINERNKINNKFIMNNHDKIFGGLENKFQEFNNGNWPE